MSNDEITMSDFDYFRKDMPDDIKELFDSLLPLLILAEAEEHEELPEPKSKDERIQTIEVYAMQEMAHL